MSRWPLVLGFVLAAGCGGEPQQTEEEFEAAFRAEFGEREQSPVKRASQADRNRYVELRRKILDYEKRIEALHEVRDEMPIPQKEDRDGTDDYRSKYRSIEHAIHRLSRECLPYREEAGEIAMRWTLKDH